ncbi:MAG: hypothetical protein QHH74_11800 [Spirochaetota bacterium]|nr:hypothetical protein [Spirochaetota bacterium]
MANKAFNKFLNTASERHRTDRELQNIVYNLNEEIKKIKGRTQAGLIKAVNLIHQETEKGSVRVPVDLGNLKHSWFWVTARGRIGGSTAKFVGKKAGRLAAGHASLKTEMLGEAKSLAIQYKGPFVIAGYSANYALWVHEMMESKGYKWFEIAIKSKQAEILKIIQDNAKIK